MNDLLKTAIDAALDAGKILKEGFDRKIEVYFKEGKHNIVTQYDHLAEEAVFRVIKQRYPTHSFLAEESGQVGSSSSDVVWVIDPLDGTVNFAHKIPFFSVSIAAVVNHEIVCGAIYNPMVDELFTASKGNGAFLKGTRLRVSRVANLSDAILATGFPYNIHENPLQTIETFAKIAKKGMPLRRLGSAALDLSYVAAGRFDAFWEVTLQPWDMAAGKLIVEEAGGRVSHYDGTPHNIFESGTLLASNGLLHDTMIAELTP